MNRHRALSVIPKSVMVVAAERAAAAAAAAAAATAPVCTQCKRKAADVDADLADLQKEVDALCDGAMAKRVKVADGQWKSVLAAVTPVVKTLTQRLAAAVDQVEAAAEENSRLAKALEDEVRDAKEYSGDVSDGDAPASAAASAAAVVVPEAKWSAGKMPFLHRADYKSIRGEVYTRCGLAPFFTADDVNGNHGVLEATYRLYDGLHDGAFSAKLLKAKKRLTFAWNNRTVSAAGRCHLRDYGYHIDFSTHILFSELTEDTAGRTSCNGVAAPDRLTALLLVMEHELVHMIQHLDADLWNNEHGAMFQAVAQGLFGHTQYRHELTLAEKVTADGTLHRFALGDRVSFVRDGETVRGVVVQITHKNLKIRPDGASDGDDESGWSCPPAHVTYIPNT